MIGINKILFAVVFSGVAMAIVSSCTSGGGEDSVTKQSPVVISVDTIKTTSQPTIAPSQFNYNIYIENSASMDGYVGSKDSITFQQAVYGLITAVKLAGLLDTPKLYFINRSIRTAIPNPITAELTEYANKLNINTFQNNRDKHTNTDIANVISLVFDSAKNDVNIIISDFIYSRGGGKASISKEAIQQNAIANIVKTFLDRKDYDIVFMQFFAQYQGTYWSESSPPPAIQIKINSPRPYYMMAIGPHEAIVQFIEKTDRLRKFRQNGFKQMCYFHKLDQSGKKPKITGINKIGNYDFDNVSNSALVVNNAENNEADSGNNRFQFTIAVDYKNIIEDTGYFLKTGNYTPISNYTLVVEAIKDTSQISTKGYSHLLKLKTKDLIKPTDNLQITLNKKVPEWVTNSSSDNDSNIQKNDQLKKTFGLKYVIEGISQAYEAKHSNLLFSVPVTVNRAPESSSNGLVFFFLILLFAGIILFVIKKIKQA